MDPYQPFSWITRFPSGGARLGPSSQCGASPTIRSICLLLLETRESRALRILPCATLPLLTNWSRQDLQLNPHHPSPNKNASPCRPYVSGDSLSRALSGISCFCCGRASKTELLPEAGFLSECVGVSQSRGGLGSYGVLLQALCKHSLALH